MGIFDNYKKRIFTEGFSYFLERIAKDERLNDIKDEMLKILYGVEILSKTIFYDKKLFPTLNNNIEKITREGAKEVLKMLIGHKVGLLLQQKKNFLPSEKMTKLEQCIYEVLDYNEEDKKFFTEIKRYFEDVEKLSGSYHIHFFRRLLDRAFNLEITPDILEVTAFWETFSKL